MRSIRNAVGVLLAALAVAGCASAAPGGVVSHGGRVRDHVSFVDNLRAHGVTVDIAGTVSQPFLRPTGTRLRLSGDGLTEAATVESYNYDTTDLGTDALQTATEDAGRIRPDGTPKTGTVSWPGPVHFFRAERVLVLYVGGDAGVVTLLTDLLGPQFAGQ
jgi:hypothetical protein